MEINCDERVRAMGEEEEPSAIIIDLCRDCDPLRHDFVEILSRNLWSFMKNWNSRTQPLWDLGVMGDLFKLAIPILEREPAVLDLDDPISVIGPLHGQGDSLLSFLSIIGHPRNRKYLFLGCYFGPGFCPIECFALLICFKIMYPDNVFLLRGHHEELSTLKQMGLDDWIELRNPEFSEYRNLIRKFMLMLNQPGMPDDKNLAQGSEMVTVQKSLEKAHDDYMGVRTDWKFAISQLMDTVSNLSIAALIDNRILCLAGGPGQAVASMGLDRMMSLEKDLETAADRELVFSCVWSVLTAEEKSCQMRDRVPHFTESELEEFCDFNALQLIIRGRQIVEDGFLNYPVRSMTLCSAAVLQDLFTNAAAAVSINGNNINVHRYRMADVEPLSCDVVKPGCGRNSQD